MEVHIYLAGYQLAENKKEIPGELKEIEELNLLISIFEKQNENCNKTLPKRNGK